MADGEGVMEKSEIQLSSSMGVSQQSNRASTSVVVSVKGRKPNLNKMLENDFFFMEY